MPSSLALYSNGTGIVDFLGAGFVRGVEEEDSRSAMLVEDISEVGHRIADLTRRSIIYTNRRTKRILETSIHYRSSLECTVYE